MRPTKIIKSLFSKKYWGGFKGRYVLSIAVGAIGIAILMTIVVPRFVFESSMQVLRDQTKTLNGALLESIGRSLEENDHEAIQEAFDKISVREPSILYLDVVDSRGHSHAKFERRPLGSYASKVFDDQGFMITDDFIVNFNTVDIGEQRYSLLVGLDNSQVHQLEETLKYFVSLLVWIIVVGIILSMVIIVEILNRPLDVLIERMADLAGGEADLTHHIEVKSQDEFGELSSWFNQFLDRIHALVSQISDGTRSVVEVGNLITVASGQLAMGAEAQQVQVTDIATSLQEMVTTMQETSQNTTEASQSAQQAAQAAVDGGSVIEQTIQGMGQISETVHQSSERIKELGLHSEKIGNIVSVIDDIADQTNLLALNANIEAARAGEHGRGFAVVADEIRALAERTIRATSEIGEMVKNIQDGTLNAVASMTNDITRVDEGVKLSEQAGDSIRQIIDLNSNVQEAIQLIAAAAQEQSHGANLIAVSIEHIKHNTEDAAGSAQMMAESAGRLDSETELLSEQVSQFKL